MVVSLSLSKVFRSGDTAVLYRLVSTPTENENHFGVITAASVSSC
jgi:hypothetical protein